MGVNMVSGLDGLRGKADDLAVFTNGFSAFNLTVSHLVAVRDIVSTADPSGDLPPRLQVLQCHDNIIGFIESNRNRLSLFHGFTKNLPLVLSKRLIQINRPSSLLQFHLRAIVQRVKEARVEVKKSVVGAIGRGARLPGRREGRR